MMTYSEYRNQFSTEGQFRRACGKLTEEEAKALIAAEECPEDLKAAMFTDWKQARREFLLRKVRIQMKDGGGLMIVFHDYDIEFDGNDFEYRYSLDAGNAEVFLERVHLPGTDRKTDVEEWLVDNVMCDGLGDDLKVKWVQMGLHGTYEVFEDYPGGIHEIEDF